MKKIRLVLTLSPVTILMFLILGLASPIATQAAATAPNLGTAASFSVLSASSMSAAGAGTTVSADLGLSPGLETSKTGPWTVGGQQFFGPSSLAFTAKADALLAYNNLVGLGQGSSSTWSLNPSPTAGLWTAASSATFAGTLTLNGGPDSVWVFKIGASLTFAGNVELGEGVNPCNVFWAVAEDATIGSGSHFVGTLIAGRSVTLVSGATVNGRILSGILTAGSLTTDGNTISGACSVGSAPAQSLRRGTINVVKTVINDNGGTKTVTDFPLFVNNTSVISGQTNTFYAPAAAYRITETTNSNYVQSFSGDCDSSGYVAIVPGDNKFCIVTNDDIGAPIVTPPVPPLIDVVKVPSPLALPSGPGTVTYAYTLKNVGIVPVTNITMVDDTCSPVSLISGDTNGDSRLDLAEAWQYSCSAQLTTTTTNIVVATGWANGISTTDIANATVIIGVPIIPPLIHVTKVPNPLTLLAGGGVVTYTEKITNPGTVALNDVQITDDKCGPVKYISGDTNGDSKLDTSETWTYTCVANLTKTTTNTAIAKGTANGFTVRDLAVATVVVATVIPKLPNTGLDILGMLTPLNIILLAGNLILATSLLVMALKRQRG